MSLAMPTPDFEPSEARLALHLATFPTQQATPEAAGEPHPGEDEADRPGDHPKLALRQLSLVFGERR
ncbi:hypothetical protein VAR608DRAFT_5913 [Variovorax sp. HW608]|uniref:hypothetical protein n=1 Tax=Variovorax sp. HW608 TaxID=1034889 RepID=UPI00081F7622|nr:hypothetical protein [Variovorax sp. HW608]SCK56694.1 hypothetical protein VAR608DRAFT_5913 [Variovorax sp. HW608]